MAVEAMEFCRFGTLMLRLVRHILRGCAPNRVRALPLVPSLLDLLQCGFGASACLSELFLDNDMVEHVPDDTIRLFINLIRFKGRRAKYIRFLEVLCTCRGKAMPNNQERVSRMLLDGAPELLLRCELVSGGHGGGLSERILVSGDAHFFPRLQHGDRMELCDWLDTTHPRTKDYFRAQIALFASLVSGRNVQTSPSLQALLPYPLVACAASSARLRRHHLDVATAFVTLARTTWVDNDIYAPPLEASPLEASPLEASPLEASQLEAVVLDADAPLTSPTAQSVDAGERRMARRLQVCEPHRKMVFVKTVRVWSRVPEIAADRMLSSRYNLSRAAAPDWEQFDHLKLFAIQWIQQHEVQNATKIRANAMTLELAKLIHDLILGGFYKSSELAAILPPLIGLLDGRGDVVGKDSDGSSAEDPSARYEKEATIHCDTVLLMEVSVARLYNYNSSALSM